jgi:P-loop Domain of unknown function (DUF2791)
MSNKRIRPKERDTVIKALRAGVVPNVGLHHIQVGRSAEIEALIRDLDFMQDGGSTVRFVIGEYGSGKTFFLNLIRLMAMEKRMVVANADLTPDKRLQSTSGHARALYAELINNLATRTKPEGGALASIIERFISQAQQDVDKTGTAVEQLIVERLASLEEFVSGYDFTRVLVAYWHAHSSERSDLKGACLRWLRGEYPNRSSAKRELPVDSVIDDDNYYDFLKLFARFVRLAGYDGVLVCFDEMVNLYKLNHQVSRSRNYEQILRILNDSLQGRAAGIGFLFGGTPEFLMDNYRGLYSYEALQSRLAVNSFLQQGLVDLSGPVLRLQNLSPEDLFILLTHIRNVFASGDPEAYLIPDEGIKGFMQHCSKHIGDAYFRTPRNSVRAFTDLLAILEQNRQVSWLNLLSTVTLIPETNPDLAPLEDVEDDDAQPSRSSKEDVVSDDDLTSFRL